MEKYIPDIYAKSIYDVNYDNLVERGIKCVLFDLDNTLIPPSMKKPSPKLVNFLNELKKTQLHFIIYSNGRSKRVKHFEQLLNLECISPAGKPFRGKFDTIIKKYHYNQSEIAIIGDQLLTDVAFGNNVGITTILVNPLSLKDSFFTRFNRMREKNILKKLYKNNLFAKGKYYE
ncbi:MAG: YqeG family HAD IIIA-type phosphatase [Bacilli bacterium]|nr:YqeG family HAD IIIA-type phosphatase [Bacilli bacterium]